MTTEQATGEIVAQAVLLQHVSAHAAEVTGDAQRAVSSEDKKLNDMVADAVDRGLMKVGGAYLSASGKVIGVLCRDERGAQSVLLTLNK
jgi:hypothetical protein